eukprot:CAMPEP_0170466426 /NCGR_PEP_ID=MMETSP0123-20130129/10393_1 /TAXON_ID=182087 /ORGANISM="Favella ehrenbergii, Strain Fehren 1" /LENGTH=61 /DNA_ID=CAMNT_0010732557 /DNA_START=622 /DNA_END=807 /DNA_ORIENTATION=+
MRPTEEEVAEADVLPSGDSEPFKGTEVDADPNPIQPVPGFDFDKEEDANTFRATVAGYVAL